MPDPHEIARHIDTRRRAKIQRSAKELYDELLALLVGHVPYADGESRLDDAFDTIDELMELVGIEPDKGEAER